jgi:hypothetical protein
MKDTVTNSLRADRASITSAGAASMSADQIPAGGTNPYANHPGFVASSCPLRYTVTQRSAYGVPTNCGFGCEMTGGHCTPGEHCADRLKHAAQQDEISRMFKATRGNP